jgi:multiple sugar transport system substrate-binding protein
MRGIGGWRRGLVVAAVASLLAACGNGGSEGGRATLNWYIFKEPSGSFEAAASSCSAASGGAYDIKLQDLPADADAQREQLVRRSAAKDSSLDILGLDVVWEAEFSEAGWIENWTGEHRQRVEQDAVRAALDTAIWKGQLVAAPFNSNTQLLWYRKDLVPNPPKTWDEMIGQAQALARQRKPHYIEIQGSSYEGYTVWVNAMVLSAGGQILSSDGQRVVLGPQATRGVEVIGKLGRSVAADPSLSVQQEDQNRLAFESGDAPFQVNYPFIYPSAQENAPDLAKQIGWTEYPRVDADKPSRPPVGGTSSRRSTRSCACGTGRTSSVTRSRAGCRRRWRACTPTSGSSRAAIPSPPRSWPPSSAAASGRRPRPTSRSPAISRPPCTRRPRQARPGSTSFATSCGTPSSPRG